MFWGYTGTCSGGPPKSPFFSGFLLVIILLNAPPLFDVDEEPDRPILSARVSFFLQQMTRLKSLQYEAMQLSIIFFPNGMEHIKKKSIIM